MPFIERNGVRVLFIHIPKTGGTTIEKWLRQFGDLRLYSDGFPMFSKCTPQHYRARDIAQLLGGDYFDYAFTVVRNPYDRIESEYRMRAIMNAATFFKSGPRFSLWLESNLAAQTQNPFVLDNHLRPQWEFIGSKVDVYKLEDGLTAALTKVAGVLKVDPPTNLPRESSSDNSPAAASWDRADRILVQQHYQRDFTEFEYEF